MSSEIAQRQTSTIAGVGVEIQEIGKGRPLLFLGAGIGLDPGLAAAKLLARHFRVLIPSHPGFGNSERPKSFTTVDDLSYFYLDLIDAYGLHGLTLVGVSFGGWIAAEIAVKSTARLSHIVLADAVGIKTGDRETRDITDIFAVTPDKLNGLIYATPEPRMIDYKSMPDDDVLTVARNREALARYAWSPYMHDPKLRSRLHRIAVPTLVLWGAKDGIVSERYGRAYAAAIPGAQFAVIDNAGHLPQVDQPNIFAQHVIDFTAAIPAAKVQTAGVL